MKIYRIKSETDPKKKYKIWSFDNGTFACECPDYAFQKKGYECKHIKKVKKYLKEKEVKKE